MAYKLSDVLRGHEMDVRGVCRSIFPAGGLISASRDRSVRVWKKDEDTKQFIEAQCFSGHQGFVASVATVPESDEYPHGLIVTGGHDNLILVWNIESLEPIQTLSGHSGAVCALAVGNFSTIFSGSWDKTAKLWLKDKCMLTLKGHEQAVWSVAIATGMMLTASADKTIKMWKAGACVKTFTGHTDCVRSLAILTQTEFISSSNDNTLRKWSTSGECIQIYEGHTNFVYSVAAFPNEPDSFVSTSEDRTIRIWKDGECAQTITLPAQSVWCSTCLDNGDIAAGSSDGTVRIFTSDPERAASEDVLKQFQEEVSSHAIPAQVSSDGKLGDIKIEDLPGPEALLRPGRSSGQNLLVKRGATIEAYQWNDAENKWDKIGEVVGAGGGSEGTSAKAGKTMFEGKEYDFVFDVDIQEGKPTLKLPFNITDDPWLAAQQFLEKNQLSQLFLDQVAQFIINNTNAFSIGPEANQSTYVDPFTGGSRYIPGASRSNEPSVIRGGADPFTGSGSYRPSYAEPVTVDNTPTTETKENITYFPEKTYLCFEQVKVDGLVGRLSEFNEKLDEDQKLSTEDISEIKNVLLVAMDKTKTGSPLSHKQVDILTKLIRWPSDICYPGLDVLRVLIRDFETSQHFVDNGDELIQYLLKVIASVSSEKMKNQDITTGVIFRIFSNLFSHEKGRRVMIKQSEEIKQCISDSCKNPNKIVQIALCTVLINYAVLFQTKTDLEQKAPWINIVRSVMNHLVENEAKFRAMVALGTFIWGDQESLSYAKTLDFLNLVNPLTTISIPQKIGACAFQLKEALR